MAGSPEGHILRVCNGLQDCPVEFQNEKAFFPFDKHCALELGVRGLAMFLSVVCGPCRSGRSTQELGQGGWVRGRQPGARRGRGTRAGEYTESSVQWAALQGGTSEQRFRG